MSLFWKIFFAVLVTLGVGSAILTYGAAVRQISNEKEEIIEEKRSISTFLGREIERGYLESRWPFESLNRLGEAEDFHFWWIVREDATIHLADRAEFMGTDASAHFPELARPPEVHGLILHRKGEYGIFVEPLSIGEKKWSFVLGFSTERISAEGIRIVVTVVFFFLVTFSFFSLVLYLVLRYHTRSIGDLVAGAEVIGKGNLSHRVKVTSQDEVGRLANSFNRMVEDLEKTTVSRDYLDALLSNLNEALLVADPSGQIQQANRAACDLLGYPEEELLEQPLGKVIALPEGTPFLEGEVGSGTKDAAFAYQETLFHTKDGQAIPVLLGSSAVRDDEGEPEWLIYTALDIRERKRAEEALRESEQRFRVAAGSTSDLVYDWDIIRGRLEWFGNIDGMLGYASGEFPRTIEAWQKGIHAQDHDRVMGTLERHLRTREPYSEEYRMVRKDGTYQYWTDRGMAFWDELGNPYRMVGACTDITEQKRAEEALRESEARYRAVIEQSPDGIYLVDAEKQCILEANPAFAQLLGYTSEEMPGLSIFEFVAAEREQVKERFQEILKGEAPLVYERQFRKKDGSLVDVWVSSIAISYWGKKAACTIVRDLTERKRAEEEREKLICELQEALANIKTLRGLVPICAHCKKIRDDKGYWQQVEVYVRDHSEAEFSHGLCPECIKTYFPNVKKREGPEGPLPSRNGR
jgi:PAS domain S-box-containing protein